MIDYLEKIGVIKLKLKELNHPDLADKILEFQLSGGTGGEVLISVCSELLKLKRNEKNVFRCIEKEVNELIQYANTIGLFPK